MICYSVNAALVVPQYDTQSYRKGCGFASVVVYDKKDDVIEEGNSEPPQKNRHPNLKLDPLVATKLDIEYTMQVT